jgi:hypothetical protein
MTKTRVSLMIAIGLLAPLPEIQDPKRALCRAWYSPWTPMEAAP